MPNAPLNSTVMPGRRAFAPRGHMSSLIALAALAVAAAAWFWMAGQPPAPRGSMTIPQAMLIVAIAVFAVVLLYRMLNATSTALVSGAGDLIMPVIWGLWLVVRAIFALIWAFAAAAFLGN